MLYVEGFFNDYFLSWVLPASPNLDDYGFEMQDLGTIIGGVIGVEVSTMRVVIGLTLALVIMSFVFKSKDFLARRDNWIGGFMIGALIVRVVIKIRGLIG